jgi:hypothetical protein
MPNILSNNSSYRKHDFAHVHTNCGFWKFGTFSWFLHNDFAYGTSDVRNVNSPHAANMWRVYVDSS